MKYKQIAAIIMAGIMSVYLAGCSGAMEQRFPAAPSAGINTEKSREDIPTANKDTVAKPAVSTVSPTEGNHAVDALPTRENIISENTENPCEVQPEPRDTGLDTGSERPSVPTAEQNDEISIQSTAPIPQSTSVPTPQPTPAPVPEPTKEPTPSNAQGMAHCSCGAVVSPEDIAGHMKQHALEDALTGDSHSYTTY